MYPGVPNGGAIALFELCSCSPQGVLGWGPHIGLGDGKVVSVELSSRCIEFSSVPGVELIW